MARPIRQHALTKVARHQYRNPIHLAQEWKRALADGKYASSADLARHIGVSRARVAQLLQVLKLSQEVIDTLLALGDPLPSHIITERNLRPIVNLPLKAQNRWIAKILTERCEH